jgi:hypothetical protein
MKKSRRRIIDAIIRDRGIAGCIRTHASGELFETPERPSMA